jgi:zinc-binding alcohol dehydrogenase/oxidoreductase
MSMLATQGRVVIAGTTAGDAASLDLGKLYSNQQSVLGSRMGYPAEFEAVLELVNAGALKPMVDKVFPLHDLALAMQYLKDGKRKGKVVVTVD